MQPVSLQSKTEAEVKNGIVAYLLQDAESKLIWGQRLQGSNIDQYPILTSDDESKVYKITFMTKSGDSYATVRRGKALAEATVTEGAVLGINNAVLSGSFAWVDGTKIANADGTNDIYTE